MATNLIISGAALVFGVNILTSVLKRWIYPRFGKLGVQVVAFALASVGALYVIYGGNYPGIQQFVTAASVVFSLSVAFYEVVLQHLDFFKVSTPEILAARRAQ